MKTKGSRAGKRRQVSVRGSTYDRLGLEADRQGLSVAQLVEKILTPSLEASRDARR